jgi:hypothetical protein
VGKLGWGVSLQRHPIKKLILHVLEIDEEWEEGREVPSAVEESDCIVRPFVSILLLPPIDCVLSRTVINGSLVISRT